MDYSDLDHLAPGQHVRVTLDALWMRYKHGPLWKFAGRQREFEGEVHSGGPGLVFVLRVGDMLHSWDPRIIESVEVLG
jgi:hypothetical protein